MRMKRSSKPRARTRPTQQKGGPQAGHACPDDGHSFHAPLEVAVRSQYAVGGRGFVGKRDIDGKNFYRDQLAPIIRLADGGIAPNWPAATELIRIGGRVAS
jgi:hypothetical protein